MNVENYSAKTFDIEAYPVRPGSHRQVSCPVFGDELTHLGSAIERLRRQIAEQAIENEGRRLRLPSMRPNDGRKADVFMLLRLNRYLNYISTWLVARVPSQWESGPSATSSRSSSGCPERSSGKHLKA
jgi:hypothetical protein